MPIIWDDSDSKVTVTRAALTVGGFCAIVAGLFRWVL